MEPIRGLGFEPDHNCGRTLCPRYHQVGQGMAESPPVETALSVDIAPMFTNCVAELGTPRPGSCQQR